MCGKRKPPDLIIVTKDSKKEKFVISEMLISMTTNESVCTHIMALLIIIWHLRSIWLIGNGTRIINEDLKQFLNSSLGMFFFVYFCRLIWKQEWMFCSGEQLEHCLSWFILVWALCWSGKLKSQVSRQELNFHMIIQLLN